MKVEEYEGLEFTEANYSQQPFGPSSRSCAKVVFGSSCGSGSLVGVRNGKSLLLTNAHVAGTRPGTEGRCWFPFWDNQPKTARIIMSGYSNRVQMDWAVLELDVLVPLPHVKLSREAPDGKHYTGGYPRCKGPVFQELTTHKITNNGTFWMWSPNSIGGQSGSGVHSFSDNLQKGLLTWSASGYGAGQTVRSIWFQYANKAEVGFPRSPDLIELSEVNSEVENGFFAEADITDLPIWAHLDNDNPPPPPPPPSGDYAELIQRVQSVLDKVGKDLSHLSELLKDYKPSAPTKPDTKPPSDGGTFGL